MLFPAFFLHQVYKGQNDTGESRDHDLFRRAQLLGNPSLQAELHKSLACFQACGSWCKARVAFLTAGWGICRSVLCDLTPSCNKQPEIANGKGNYADHRSTHHIFQNPISQCKSHREKQIKTIPPIRWSSIDAWINPNIYSVRGCLLFTPDRSKKPWNGLILEKQH